jgi:hypothetical protein
MPRPGVHPSIPWFSLKSTQYTTPLGMTIPSVDRIEVTDPTHPLYGLTLPCLGVTTKQRLGRVCVVWLAPGVERLIPLTATNLALVVPSPPSCRLSVSAVQNLLAVLPLGGDFLSATISQEVIHGPSTASDPTATPVSAARSTRTRRASARGSHRGATAGVGNTQSDSAGTDPPSAPPSHPGGAP